MTNFDRKLAWAAIAILAVIALEFAWFWFVGPANSGANQAANNEAKDLFLGLSAEAWTAIFTGVLTGSTIGLWITTGQTANIAKRQTELLEAQRVIDHRPRLYVRHVALGPKHAPPPPPELPSLGDELQGGLAVVNSGGTPAKIIESFYTVHFSQGGLPMRTPLDVGKMKELILLPRTLAVGESLACSVSCVVPKDLQRQGSFIILKSRDPKAGWTIYVMGQIQYADSKGNRRFMGFCRQYSGGDGTFQPVSDPDYEYQD